MSHDWLRPSLLAGILCAAIPQAGAHDLLAELAACRGEKADAQRLACYDREVAKAGEQSTAPSVPATQAATTQAATPQTPEERFGYRGALAREEIDKKKLETRDLEELVSTLTGISTQKNGAMVFTLENGQVWAQNNPDPFFHVKSGETVKIEPAALGSFMMIGPSKRTTRVTRQK